MSTRREKITKLETERTKLLVEILKEKLYEGVNGIGCDEEVKMVADALDSMKLFL